MARRRNKAVTREAILEAAREVLASDGPDALSLSKVANLAGINRGTAYQHFETREDLIKATVNWVSDYLTTTIYGGIDVDEEGHWQGGSDRPIEEVVARIVEFSMENPALCRIWLFELLSSEDPGKDHFFSMFKESTRELAESDVSQDGIDVEALSVIMLAGYFLWPVWVGSHAQSEKDRNTMGERMRREVLRLFMHGVLKSENFPQLQAFLDKKPEKK